MVDLDTESDRPMVFVVGPDRAGNMLEVIALLLAEDREIAIHAMPLSKKSYRLIEGPVMTEGKTYKTRTGKVLPMPTSRPWPMRLNGAMTSRRFVRRGEDAAAR